jgi:hypothetical protein
VAVVGDCRIEVFAYRVDWRGELPRIEAAARPVVIAGTGTALWCREVVLAVRERCPSALDPRYDALLWPAAAEFGARLAAADEAEMLEWAGPLSDRMAAPVQFSRTDCLAWDSVARLRMHLPTALSYTANALGVPGAEVLVCGPGARWPFASAVAAVRTLDAPELTVARGAAWWPDISESLFVPGLEDEFTPVPVEALGSDLGATMGTPPYLSADETKAESPGGEDWRLLSEYVDRHGSSID